MINLKKIENLPLSDKINIVICLIMAVFLIVVMRNPFTSAPNPPLPKTTTEEGRDLSLKDIGSLDSLENMLKSFSGGDLADEDEMVVFTTGYPLYFKYPSSWMIIEESMFANNSSRFETIFTASRASISNQASVVVSKIAGENNIDIVKSLIEEEIINNDSSATVTVLKESDDFLIFSINDDTDSNQQLSVQQKVVCSTDDCFIVSFVIHSEENNYLLNLRENLFTSVKIKK